jgi:hypothetical protein
MDVAGPMLLHVAAVLTRTAERAHTAMGARQSLTGRLRGNHGLREVANELKLARGWD